MAARLERHAFVEPEEVSSRGSRPAPRICSSVGSSSTTTSTFSMREASSSGQRFENFRHESSKFLSSHDALQPARPSCMRWRATVASRRRDVATRGFQ